MARLNYNISAFNATVGTPNTCRVGLAVTSNYTGTPKSRVYLSGDPPPAFTNMVLGGTTYTSYDATTLRAPGIYTVEYQDGNGTRVMGQIEVFDENSCCLYDQADYVETLITYRFYVLDSKITFLQSIAYSNPSSLVIDRTTQASIDGGTTWKTMTILGGGSSTVEWTNSEIAALGISETIITVLFRRNLTSCLSNPAEELTLDVPEYDDMEVTPVVSNVTSNGGDDGAISLTITGGSGSRTYLWSTTETTQNISGLEAGIYSVTVTDSITSEVVTIEDIQVFEPQIQPVNGSFLEVPFMNSISFVVSPVVPDDSEYFQQLDNVLFCEQEHPNFQKVNYFQKVIKADTLVTQFNTDFGGAVISLYDYTTDELVKNFTSELKEQNIGVSEDFQINIRNHTTAGQSRIYFTTGALPIPLDIGDVFEILNSPDGYNGNYSIVDILTDTSFGYQYLVINKNFTGPGLSPLATGRFTSDNADFNVFESVHTFLDVANGLYYIKITVSNDDLTIEAISEPIDLQVRHLKTKLVEYRNTDNGFGLTFTTGYIGKMRIPATFGIKRLPGGEISTSRNSDFSLSTTAGMASRGLLFETVFIPPYLHEKLSVLMKMDFKSINKLQVQTTEGFSDPQFKDGCRLLSSSIKVEQATWFDRYNSDDIGTVAEGGFITTETGGYLKR